jgi:hypothetical protein
LSCSISFQVKKALQQIKGNVMDNVININSRIKKEEVEIKERYYKRKGKYLFLNK